MPSGDEIVPEEDDVEQFPAQHPKNNQPHPEISNLFGFDSFAGRAARGNPQADHESERDEHPVRVDVEWTDADEVRMHSRKNAAGMPGDEAKKAI